MEKKIHYCWFGGKKLPKSVEKCIKTWKKMLPEYEIIEWNESNFDINICPFVKEAYENKKWAFVSDYVRIYALYKYGGIYFDTDVKVIKDVSKIVDKDMFLGYEDSGFIGTAVIGVKEKNNKYIKEILDYYNKQEEFNSEIMYNYANPVIITKILKKYSSHINDEGIEIIDNNIYIYPREYFYPLSYNYDEKEFTENTCMIHLFNATWTSKGEKRTVYINRKLGPDVGKTVNEFIDKLGKIKNNIKKFLLNIYKSLRMWYSVHFNRNKRVKNIEDKLKEISGEEILICNPDISLKNQYLENTYKNIIYLREQYTEKEASLMAQKIVNANIEKVIFNSIYYGWKNLISNIKRRKKDIKIEIIIHGGNATNADGNTWQMRDEIIDLYAKRRIDKLLFFNKYYEEFYNKKGYKTKLINRDINISNKEKYKKISNKKYIKIGMYTYKHDVSQNIYNQLCAISLLENVKLDFNPINYQIATTSRRFNINLCGDSKNIGQEELYYRLANNDINLSIELIDDDSVIPLQSFELGTICLIGRNCTLFDGSELEKHIKIKNEENIEEIKEKIEEALMNKEKILNLYNIWKELR